MERNAEFYFLFFFFLGGEIQFYMFINSHPAYDSHMVVKRLSLNSSASVGSKRFQQLDIKPHRPVCSLKFPNIADIGTFLLKRNLLIQTGQLCSVLYLESRRGFFFSK